MTTRMQIYLGIQVISNKIYYFQQINLYSWVSSMTTQHRSSLPVGRPQPIVSNRKLENLNCIEPPTSNSGGLYLGDIVSTLKLQLLDSYNIQAILSCISDQKALKHITDKKNYSKIINHKIIQAQDIPTYPINQHFDQSFDFIERMRKNNMSVLVHCHAGLSRSASIVCAYLMKKNDWSAERSLNYVREKRYRVRPNQGFFMMLQQYEKRPVVRLRKAASQNQSCRQQIDLNLNYRMPIRNTNQQKSVDMNQNHSLRKVNLEMDKKLPPSQMRTSANRSHSSFKRMKSFTNIPHEIFESNIRQKQLHPPSLNHHQSMRDEASLQKIQLNRKAGSEFTQNEEKNKLKFGIALKNRILSKVESNIVTTLNESSPVKNYRNLVVGSEPHCNLFSSFSSQQPNHSIGN